MGRADFNRQWRLSGDVAVETCENERGRVQFQSHLDGSEHMLTPERSIEIQTLLGANIRMALDECTPFPATHEQAESSWLSMRWAARSKKPLANMMPVKAMRCSA